MDVVEKISGKLKRDLAKKAGKVTWCEKGGQHFAKSRADSAKCQKCGMTIAEIKEQIQGKVTERYPEIPEDGVDKNG